MQAVDNFREPQSIVFNQKYFVLSAEVSFIAIFITTAYLNILKKVFRIRYIGNASTVRSLEMLI
jgi:hypothetical protein